MHASYQPLRKIAVIGLFLFSLIAFGAIQQQSVAATAVSTEDPVISDTPWPPPPPPPPPQP